MAICRLRRNRSAYGQPCPLLLCSRSLIHLHSSSYWATPCLHRTPSRGRQNIGRRFLSPDEQDAGNIRHLRRPDRLHVAQARDEEHAVTIQCQDIAHQVAGEGTLHFVVFPAVTTHDCRAGKCYYLPYLHIT